MTIVFIYIDIVQDTKNLHTIRWSVCELQITAH